jgi:CRISPR type I-E-associated protein CasB/Cse2
MSDSTQSLPAAETAESSKSPEQRARAWWRTMISDADGDRGARAQLRRCVTARDALGVPAAIGLAKRLGCLPDAEAPLWKQRDFERALGLAIVLAQVRREPENGRSLMRQLGWGQFPYAKKDTDADTDAPKLSELRFKRFLQTEGEDELIQAFARLVKLAGNETNVADLAKTFLEWDRDRTKQHLALDYFNARKDALDL